ncbi:hypothetical protein HQ346_19115 [Rhodococcus sp. BP-252]|nr:MULTISPECIES: hypothetical protein [Rhodococcus]MBY6412976.1 hypothetical protein [Rhodococcus sp. BP-320]MBY6418585.1 hypothetical protein [Rhodococcus sp. BP-321]MBY6422713.1 hypothetical protein [Rhodococcus sp. BP-324]MBY6428449.1 hypothetical protein [Rhodococcus sp. BP-323]MBY6432898.1 hypothetical protein [Rhodococcus sp. BP-322]
MTSLRGVAAPRQHYERNTPHMLGILFSLINDAIAIFTNGSNLGWW